jgi:hypothetical protein
MSAYLWAVQIGMPEGMKPSDQQLWLHKWLLEKDATVSLLVAERETANRTTDECMLEVRRLTAELAARIGAVEYCTACGRVAELQATIERLRLQWRPAAERPIEQQAIVALCDFLGLREIVICLALRDGLFRNGNNGALVGVTNVVAWIYASELAAVYEAIERKEGG